MPLFLWKPSYELKVQEIDHDHRQLVGMINELYEAMKIGQGHELIDTLIDQLLDYAGQHFETEEGFMRANHYPFLAAHEREHREFREKIGEMDRCRRKGEQPHSTEMLNFLCEWLRNHILESDKDFGTFLKRHETA